MTSNNSTYAYLFENFFIIIYFILSFNLNDKRFLYCEILDKKNPLNSQNNSDIIKTIVLIFVWSITGGFRCKFKISFEPNSITCHNKNKYHIHLSINKYMDKHITFKKGVNNST